jgi:hypothetical protein
MTVFVNMGIFNLMLPTARDQDLTPEVEEDILDVVNETLE